MFAKTLLFLLNGVIFGTPKKFQIEEEKIELIGPFVDIYTQGDQLGIVESSSLLLKQRKF